ncbi:hypothetical protein LTR36_009910 [Oleoguttula mirabilis]|uniref:Uncharacterized protein n=1 Tax=Oleoguttula mirabilis TaxID=1507867 RepID=A0AAV9J4W4_9PEZI|nr:hypothetical protein LTR36_009910 [Oleoguttula mirabilis]
MSYDYKIAKDVLSDTDKNRIVCLYLSCNTTAINGLIDWEKARAAFDCTSVDSMKVMTRSALKKIEKAGGKEGVDAEPEKAKSAGSKKKRGKVPDDGDEQEESPKKKGKATGGRKKKTAVPASDEDDAEAASGAVKQEDGDELT